MFISAKNHIVNYDFCLNKLLMRYLLFVSKVAGKFIYEVRLRYLKYAHAE